MVDIIIILDESGTIRDETFQQLLGFLQNLVLALPGTNMQFGLVTFATEVTIQFHLNAHSNNGMGTAALLADIANTE